MVAPKRILVVDDHIDTTDLIEQWMTMHGHEVEIANDRDAALEKIRSRLPDIVLADYHMDGLNAHDFIAHCKAVCPNCRIAMMSGAKAAQSFALQAGVHRLFTKPFDIDDILKFVQH